MLEKIFKSHEQHTVETPPDQTLRDSIQGLLAQIETFNLPYGDPGSFYLEDIKRLFSDLEKNQVQTLCPGP